jgi:uncharacterized protein (TIGR03643 family)
VKSKIEKLHNTINEEDKDRFVRMCWEDRTPFEAVKEQFGLTPNEAVKFMRKVLAPKDFKRWRERANNLGHLKHLKTRSNDIDRFKCSRQNLDGSTKGYK